MNLSADTTQLRAHNSALLLNLIWQAGEISRAELARQSGMSRSTVSAIVAGRESSLGRDTHGDERVARGGRCP